MHDLVSILFIKKYSKGWFIVHELNSGELTRNKSTQLHNSDLIGCSETRTVGAQSVRAL